MMTSTMSFNTMASLFAAMVLLAAVPSVSVLAVTTRAASLGFWYGAFTATGIVAGDMVFIAIALTGLSELADRAGSLWYLIQYAAACYLFVMGALMWRSRPTTTCTEATDATRSYVSSFVSGFVLTLGDQKAILFYLGFFPAFIDLHALKFMDVLLILLITLISVLGVKLVYAHLAGHLGSLLGNRMGPWMNRIAGAAIMGVGVYIVLC